MEYTAIIRSLGKAGAKYQQELDSLLTQTIPPTDIIVYLAEGYDIPPETCGRERYVYVPKGMVAQRALRYEEVKTEYVLFLDDDVFLPTSAVETLFAQMTEAGADVAAPYVFDNHKASFTKKISQSLMGKEFCRIIPDNWGYRVLRTGGFSYRSNVSRAYCKSQANTGPCVLCRLSSFLSIHFEDELWLDEVPYALPEDQVMTFKMFKKGIEQITSYNSGIVHLDAGSTLGSTDDKVAKLIRSEYRNKIIFWHRFFFLPDGVVLKLWDLLCIGYVIAIQSIKASLKYICGNRLHATALVNGLKDGLHYIHTDRYKTIPRV